MEPLGPCQTLRGYRLEQQAENLCNPSNLKSEVSVGYFASTAMVLRCVGKYVGILVYIDCS